MPCVRDFASPAEHVVDGKISGPASCRRGGPEEMGRQLWGYIKGAGLLLDWNLENKDLRSLNISPSR